VDRADLLAFSVSSLCRGVDVLELDRLLSSVPCSVEEYRTGSLVLHQDTHYDSLRIILSGSVTAEMHHRNGKSVVIETIEAPDPIAPAILFAPGRRLPVTVSAASELRLLSLPLETILDLCRLSRQFLINFLSEIGGKLSLFAEKFRLLEFSGLRHRIAAYLSPRLSDGVCVLPYSKEKLSEFLSVARPSLSRELSAMADEGVLAFEGRRITVLDENRFNAILEEDPE